MFKEDRLPTRQWAERKNINGTSDFDVNWLCENLFLDEADFYRKKNIHCIFNTFMNV